MNCYLLITVTRRRRRRPGERPRHVACARAQYAGGRGTEVAGLVLYARAAVVAGTRTEADSAHGDRGGDRGRRHVIL